MSGSCRDMVKRSGKDRRSRPWSAVPEETSAELRIVVSIVSGYNEELDAINLCIAAIERAKIEPFTIEGARRICAYLTSKYQEGRDGKT
jgi:hypothetical protein